MSCLLPSASCIDASTLSQALQRSSVRGVSEALVAVSAIEGIVARAAGKGGEIFVQNSSHSQVGAWPSNGTPPKRIHLLTLVLPRETEVT